MAAHTIRLDHVNSIIKFTANSPGAGATYTIGLGTTGFTGQTVSSGGTIGLALFGTGNSETIGTPSVHIRKVRWSCQSGTTNGIRITRNGVDTLQLFTSGDYELGSLAENSTSNITITIDGSGTLIMDLFKASGFEPWSNELYLQNSSPIFRG
jgi:hypothetical protein